MYLEVTGDLEEISLCLDRGKDARSKSAGERKEKNHSSSSKYSKLHPLGRTWTPFVVSLQDARKQTKVCPMSLAGFLIQGKNKSLY